MVHSGAPWEAIAGYSRAVQVGNTIHVAGTTAPGDTGAEQLTHAVAIIQHALHELGASLSDVVRTRMYVTDITGWEPIAKAHGALFGDIRPVTAMVEVSALVEPWMLVEVEAVAIVPDRA
jgi:enamine deaminase RidA (YjgF/YER057c/UK114 family)